MEVRPDHRERPYETCECIVRRPRNVPEKRQRDTFGTFDLGRNPSMAKAMARCRAIAAGREWAGLLYGTYGNGKTHLAIAALNEFGRGQFWKVPDMLGYIRRRVFDDKANMDDVIKSFVDEMGLLVLDDLGVENPTEWAGETLYRILDGRCDAEHPTILTTNTDLNKLDPRIVSRYGRGLVVCSGKDVRLDQ